MLIFAIKVYIMDIINRDLKDRLEKHYNDKKALIIFGPRQSGKTTLIQEMIKDIEKPYQLWNGDDFQVRSSLQNISIASLPFAFEPLP